MQRLPHAAVGAPVKAWTASNASAAIPNVIQLAVQQQIANAAPRCGGVDKSELQTVVGQLNKDIAELAATVKAQASDAAASRHEMHNLQQGTRTDLKTQIDNMQASLLTSLHSGVAAAIASEFAKCNTASVSPAENAASTKAATRPSPH